MITGNNSTYGGDAIYYYYTFNPPAQVINSIVWGEQPENVVAGESGSIDITYSDVAFGYEGEGNIALDPLFTAGPRGNYYLSQVSAGQSTDSPCVNAGSTLSGSFCFSAPVGYTEDSICISDIFTRTDHVNDSGIVDIGYHYSDDSFPDLKSLGVYNAFDSLMDVHVQFNMPKLVFDPGDIFFLDCRVTSTQNSPVDCLLFVWLDIFGEYYFFPGWGHYGYPDYDINNITCLPITVGDETITVLPEFIWPEIDEGMSNIYFYAACTDRNVQQIISNIEDLRWEYNGSR
jgi:hypothetical protein